jgi:hypothetical protein
VVVHDLRVGQARATLRCWRDADGSSKYEVLRKHGSLRVVRQPPPESIDAGLVPRAKAAVETIVRAVS